LLILITTVLTRPSGLSGQSDITGSLLPRIGIWAPQGTLFDVPVASGVHSEARIDDGITIGIAWELNAEDLGLALRMTVDHLIRAQTRVSSVRRVESSAFDLPHFERSTVDLGSSITELSADLILPLHLRILSSSP
jgi:hypothetical protein